MTTFSQEMEEQKRWVLRPQHASLRLFDVLLENEFRPPEHHDAGLDHEVRSIVAFAVAHTPYYAEVFARLRLRADSIGGTKDLIKLPVLHKYEVIQFNDGLASRWLPPGERVLGPVKSSGTTGRPVTVIESVNSSMMYGLMRQRSSRWFRLDPLRTRVDVRPRSNRFHRPKDLANPGPPVIRSSGWWGLDTYFHTGPEFAFNMDNPIEQHIAWLREIRPHYAMTLPGIFAEWLLANGGKVSVDSLETLIGVAAEMTPSLRRHLEKAYKIPIQQLYGLNEIGPVAVRCSAGRYHVNVEHCHVEIAGEDGRPCAAGEIGHLLVTGFRNLAMPLIRYDTGDLAEAVSGSCPCGRTLPSFGDIAGRHRNYAGLPSGSRERVQAIRGAMEECSPETLAFFQRYQIHQDRENRFTLKLQTQGTIPENFRDTIYRAWNRVGDVSQTPLAIVAVKEIAVPYEGKLHDLVSEFHTDSSVPPEPPASRAGEGVRD